ncbi:MAG: adenylate kinase [Candidatus Aenigmarchaeota archaeon]|nr:adenylate kinase [Candidatus Aenigmarchaeota archaeon]
MKIVFLGPPGSGKGTYASRLSPMLGIPHISTGDIFREHLAKKTPLGKKIEDIIKSGGMVPDDIVMDVVKDRIGKPDCSNGFIFDGFPRTMEQARALAGLTKLDCVLNLVLDEKIIIEKMSARRVCEKCGEIYNVADIRMGKYRFPPILPKKEGVCDKCGGKLVQRKDDTVEVIKDRLEVYKKQTKPLIDYYRKKSILKDVRIVGPPEAMVPIILKTLGRQ